MVRFRLLLLVLGLLLCQQALTQVSPRPFRGTISTAGTDCSTATNCVVVTLPENTASATIAVDADTGSWSGTLQFEGSVDGTAWIGMKPTPNSSDQNSSATVTGSWQFNPSSYIRIRVRASARSSGTAAITINWSTAVASSGVGISSGGSVSNSGTLTSGKCVKGAGTTVVTVDSGCSIAAGVVTASGFVGPVTGAVTGDVTGNVSGSSGSSTGNAASATVLQTTRTLNGTNFNGSANVTIPVNNADDTTTNADFYPLFTPTVGANAAANVASTKFKFHPSTGMLTVTGVTSTFTGNLTGNVTGNTSGSAGSVAWSGVSATPTTISGYGITDALALAGTSGQFQTNNGSGNLAAVAPTGSGTKVVTITETSAAAGDKPCYTGASTIVNCEPGFTYNSQTGANYAIVAGDKGKIVVLSNAAAQTPTLPNCASTTGFDSLWYTLIYNAGAGTQTLTPATSTINGGATVELLQGQGGFITCDGTNYHMVISTAPLAGGPVTQIEHVITFNISATGAFNKSFEADFACTIYKATITSDGGTSGTAAIDIWKHASGTIPTSGDKISGTGWTPLSGAALLQDSTSTLSGWTSTTVARGDLFGGTSTLTTITGFTLQLFCH